MPGVHTTAISQIQLIKCFYSGIMGIERIFLQTALGFYYISPKFIQKLDSSQTESSMGERELASLTRHFHNTVNVWMDTS